MHRAECHLASNNWHEALKDYVAVIQVNSALTQTVRQQLISLLDHAIGMHESGELSDALTIFDALIDNHQWTPRLFWYEEEHIS